MRQAASRVLWGLLLWVGCVRGSGGERPPDRPDGGPHASADGGSDAGCQPPALLEQLGRRGLLVGAEVADATAAVTPLDIRYSYLSGGLPDDTAACEASCAVGCTAQGTLCSSDAGCDWWGCAQWDQEPPGAFVRKRLQTTADAAPPQIPMFSYYEILQTSGTTEGPAEVLAVQDVALMRRYFDDWRFLLQLIGDRQVLLHLEPDFWGYAMQLNSDPHALAAAVSEANPTDCASEESSVAGLGRCLVSMVRRYAPNAAVGLHASSWATGPDVEQNVDPSLDVIGEAHKLATFLKACGEDEADFVVLDAADRDAGWEATQGVDTWWDPSNQRLPDFTQALAWAKALGRALGKPVIWWQLPFGNMSLPNLAPQWQDNRLDYFFDHPEQVAEAGGMAMLFGAGNSSQTTAETDHGHFVDRVQAFTDGGRPDVCR